MSDLLQRVEESIAARQLFRRGQSILAAVSGGLDSMVLLHLLTRLSGAHGWRLTVAHFNHQLRGRSSDADERLVKRTAEKSGLPFYSGAADVRAYARRHKISLEMAARKLRHEFFARVATKRTIQSIALAHHADDQVELFFLRLLRGAGGEGLAGMRWQSPSPASAKISLVRPLLDQPKSEIQAYAKQHKVTFREDATNAQTDILRNRIRHELLPLLTRTYQPALSRIVLRQMDIIGAGAAFVNEAAEAWLKSRRRSKFEMLPIAVQRRCIRLQLTAQGVVANFDLVEQIRESANRPVAVSKQIFVRRDDDGTVLAGPASEAGFKSGEIEVNLSGGAGEVVFKDVRIQWEVKAAVSGIFRAPKPVVGCEIFDADELGPSVILRHWRPGDRFRPIGMGFSVKLQDLFINQKISRDRRHELLVGTAGSGGLFWVEGMRIAEHVKVDKSSIRLLNWRWQRL